MQRHERERRRRERAVGFDAIARDEREADPEEQIDQGDNGNGAGPPRRTYQASGLRRQASG
jgi:hypothetical protein